MPDLWQRLRQRKLVQWALAYLAAAWVLLQVLDLVGNRFEWPAGLLRGAFIAAGIGFIVTLLLAWYHGERGAQKVTGIELLLLALVLAIGGVALWRYAPAPAAPHATAMANRAAAPVVISPKSIAVLPFENLSSDTDNAYFASGMQDLILTKLADIAELKVTSRTSTMQYGSRPPNLRRVAAELGVAVILEGSVQKQGNQVMINVQLIDARSDTHLWAQTYQRTLDNIFGVEGEVADKIADALHASLSPDQSERLARAPTTNRTAYDFFLRAEYQASRFDIDEDTGALKSAITLYRQAVESDPRFALAFARLSMAESSLAFFGGGGEDVAGLKQHALDDAGSAMTLQPELPAARLALGYSAYWGRRDYDAALQAFGAVLSSHPNYADALAAQGYVQRRRGDFDAAIDSLTRAVALDPRDFTLIYRLGNTHMMVRRYRDAIALFERARTLEPNSVAVKSSMARAIINGSGEIERALAVVQGDADELKPARGELLVYLRHFDAAVALYQSIPDTPENFPPGSSKAGVLALLHWLAGDKAQARILFAQALLQDRAALASTEGIDQALVWNAIGLDEIGSGNTAAGLAAIAKAEAILDQSHDSLVVPNQKKYDAIAYAMAGRADLAVPLLTRVLAAPGAGETYGPPLLWIDPSWDPIRATPQFKALQARYAASRPVIAMPADHGD